MEEYIHRRWFIFGVFCTGLTGLLCGLLIGFGYGYTRGKDAFVSGQAVRVDTAMDTVRIVEPRAADSVVTGVIRVPVVLPMEPDVPKAEIEVFEPDSLFSERGAAAVQLPTQPFESELYGANGGEKGGDGGEKGVEIDGVSCEARKRGKFARNDTVWIDLPRTQKKYEDSTYVAWVSGSYAITWTQRALGLKVDGKVGPVTVAAINKQPSKELFVKLHKLRLDYIDYICKKNANNLRYKKGWVRRINAIGYGSLTYANGKTSKF